MRYVVVALSVGLVMFGCAGEEKPATSPSPKAPEKPATSEATKPVAKAEDPKAQVASVLAAWCQTQTDGDFKAYSALYTGKFKGIKRVKGGKTKTYDLPGWLKDRGLMFKKPLHVDCKNPKVTMGGDGKTASVTFEQYWRSGSYADQGDKRLDLEKADAGWRLVGEEMLNSKKWDTKTFRDGSKAPKASFATDETKVKIPQMLKEMTTREGPRCYRKCLKKKPKDWKEIITTNQDKVFRHPSAEGCEIYCMEMHRNFE